MLLGSIVLLNHKSNKFETIYTSLNYAANEFQLCSQKAAFSFLVCSYEHSLEYLRKLYSHCTCQLWVYLPSTVGQLKNQLSGTSFYSYVLPLIEKRPIDKGPIFSDCWSYHLIWIPTIEVIKYHLLGAENLFYWSGYIMNLNSV